jgi:hypothetical protein
MVPIDEIDAPELMLWLSSNQAVGEHLRLEAQPVGGNLQRIRRSQRLVDFDYQCFGEKGCWLTAAFAEVGSAPALLLANRLHGTHEQKTAPGPFVGDGLHGPSQGEQEAVAELPRE